MTPTPLPLASPEGPSDLCFTMFFVFIIFCFASFSSSEGLKALLGSNMGPTWGPWGTQNRPKWTFQIDPGSLFFGFDVGRPWKIDLGAIWKPSWGYLGPILGASGANLGPSWAILGSSWSHLGAMVGHLGAILGPSCHRRAIWGHLGVILGQLGAILGPSKAM